MHVSSNCVVLNIEKQTKIPIILEPIGCDQHVLMFYLYRN